MKVKDVISWLEKIAPPDSGIVDDDNRLLLGDENTEIKAVGVAWMATTPVIKEAIEKGVNFLIVHERLFFGHQESDWYEDSEEDQKEVNKIRKDLLEKNKIAVYRAHSNWDCLREHGVTDSLGFALGYKKVVRKTKFIKTYEIPTKKLKAIAEEIKEKLKLQSLRVYGDLNSQVSRITPLIGGFGGNQKNMPEIAKKHGSQVIIVGDLVEYILIHAQELGISVIETVHSASETPGLKSLFNLLKETFPQIPIYFFNGGCLFFKGFEPKIL